MRIGFDISQTGMNKAGCGHFAESLISALTNNRQENSFILYPYFGTTFWDTDAKNKTYRINLPGVSRKIIAANYNECMTFWKNLPSNGEIQLGNPDIIHSNNFSAPKGLKTARLVYTLHDLGFLEYPEYTTELNRWICFNGVFNASIYADFVIAVSNYSREKFLEIFPHYPANRIKVVHLGTRFSLAERNKLETFGLPELRPDQFWLTVGTLEPRKNIRNLLKAFARYVKNSKVHYPLVLTGGKGWLEDELPDFIKSLGIESTVILTGYVSDDQLAWLYYNCYAFLYPSYYEGFGLPVLEAMSMGAAVITSNTTSIPEFAGSSVYYVDPYRVEDITNAMLRISEDPMIRNELKSLALKQSMKYSWEKCASEVMDIYNETLTNEKYWNNNL